MIQAINSFSSFSVNDIPKAKAFYSEKLGLKVKDQPEGLQVETGTGQNVFLYPKPNHVPATFTVLNFSVKNIDESVNDLKRQGIQFEQYAEPPTGKDGIFRDHHGHTIAWFKDPAGNILSLLQED